MQGFIQDGATLEVTAPAAVTSGVGVLVGTNLFGVALGDAASGALVRIRTEGVVDIAKNTSLAISAGDRVYWNNSAKEVNKTATSNVCVGVAVRAAGSSDATARIKLCPVVNTAVAA